LVRDVTGGVLLLTPSCGRGGGIERYAETLEWAFTAQDVEYQRIDLRHPGPLAHGRMLAHGRRLLRQDPRPTRLVLAHRGLLPVASLLTLERSVRGMSVVCHGGEVWDGRIRLRRLAENRLMRRPGTRVVAVSSFTAGTLAEHCRATVMPPGLSREWFDTLVDASIHSQVQDQEVHLVTAFRLLDWRNKGLPQLLEAVSALGRPDVRVSVCGTGEPPTELRRLVRERSWCVLRPGLTNRELARQLAAADLFVLATRTRVGRHPCGEGFGLALLEAQVAGTPVVGPAYGGSHDAYINGVTGLTPPDETVGGLATVLSELLRDTGRLEQMGRHAAVWAREAFAPERYASLAVARLL